MSKKALLPAFVAQYDLAGNRWQSLRLAKTRTSSSDAGQRHGYFAIPKARAPENRC